MAPIRSLALGAAWFGLSPGACNPAPTTLAGNAVGVLYFGDSFNSCIRQITP